MTFGTVIADHLMILNSTTFANHQALSLTTLAVTQATMLGTTTTCMSPLAASCYDISSQSCASGPLDGNCLPANPTFGTVTARELVLLNNTVINAQVADQEILSIGYLSVNQTLALAAEATMTCAGGIETIAQNCFSLAGKTCPMGQPVSESCIPDSLVFLDATVTNTLTVNELACAGGAFNASCIPVISIEGGGTNSVASLSNNRIMVSAAGAIVESAALSNLQVLTGTTGTSPAVRTLIAGTGMTVTQDATTVTFANTGKPKAVSLPC
jgi:hypothetical protein